MITELDLFHPSTGTSTPQKSQAEKPVVRESRSAQRSPAAPRNLKKDVRIFAAELARLLAGGVPLLRCLQILAVQRPLGKFRSAIEEVTASVREGLAFSSALERYRKIFPAFFIEMIRAGEISGTLEETLKMLSLYLKREEEMRRKIIEAVSYPLFVFLFGCLSIVFLLQFVVPKITGIYDDLNGTLPLLTRMVLALSRNSGTGLLVLCLATAPFLFFFLKRRDILFSRLIALPLCGPFLLDAVTERFFSLLALLTRSGIPILEALRTCARTSSAPSVRQPVTNAAEKIAQGSSLAQAFESIPWMHESLVALISSGEESGKLADTFSQIAAESNEQLESRAQIFLKLLEPVLILTVGLIVGLIVISAILPVFEMNDWMK